jgi:ribosomal-protein-alanine N-acetyltransferase
MSPLSHPPTDWIETERTRLRPFEETDAEPAHAWLSDPAVMRFIPRGADAALEDTQRRIAWYREHQTRFGFSKRIIVNRETGQAIGDSGLFYMPDGKRIELGYRLARSHWGMGLATEVGEAWLQWFHRHFPDEPLFADVHADNLPSQRILSKLGFVPSHSELLFEMPMLIYRYAGEQTSSGSPTHS